MTVRLAFSTNAFTRFTLGQACTRIAKAGYRGVEILADEPHAYPSKVYRELAIGLRKTLDDLRLEVSNVNANTMFGFWNDPPPEPFFEPSLVSTNEQFRQARLHGIRVVLDFAARIAARNISITTGKPLGAMSPEACEPLLEDMLGRVLDRAEKLGIDVGIECEPGLFIETTEELVRWIDRMRSPRLGANLDLGHVVVAGEDPLAAIEKLRGRIWNIHLEDIRGRKHYHRIPGEGDIDFPAIADALRGIGYDRWVTVELYTQSADPDRAARRSLKVLGTLFPK